MKSTSFFNDKNNMTRKVRVILLLAIMALGCYLMGYFRARKHFREATKMIQVDTMVVRDTIRISGPVEIRYEKLTETLILPKVDTLRLRDTIYLVVNKQIKEYRDSLYYARVSGYEPSLDYIEVYPRTTVISKTETTTLKPSAWRYGLDIGMNYGKAESNYITPFIGAEVGYKKFTLRTEVGANVGMVERMAMAPIPYWQIGVKYRFLGR